MGRGRFDIAAFAAAGLAIGMLVVYVSLMHQQDDQPLAWFTAAMVAGAALAAYGVCRSAPHRRVALLVAAAILGVCGLLGLLTIGAPVLLAAVLCLLAGLIERPTTAER